MIMTVDQFVNELQRPLYVYKMAKAMTKRGTASQQRGARKRMRNAQTEIDLLIRKYMGES